MIYQRMTKDVEEAYRRGFEAGFNVRPNPVAMVLRSMWRKHEMKKLKREWKRKIKENGGFYQIWSHDHTNPIGIVIQEDRHA